jgi:hypothetical protein
VLEQFLWCQVARLPPIKNRVGDIRREIAEADKTSEIGGAHPFPPGQCSKGHTVAAGEDRVEPARSDQQLDQARIGFRRGERVGAIDQQHDLPSGAAQLHRDGQDLGFTLCRRRRLCGCEIEETAKPCRAQMDVDLRGGDVDPIDQGGQESTLTCCGQFAHYETSAANSWQYATVDDVPKAAKDWPQINFVIYHAAKQAFLVPPDDELTEFEKNGYIRWVSDLAAIPQKHGVSNVYGEIGSAFANSAVANPRCAAAMMGTLIKGMGADHVVWGTDSAIGGDKFAADRAASLHAATRSNAAYGYVARRA